MHWLKCPVKEWPERPGSLGRTHYKHWTSYRGLLLSLQRAFVAGPLTCSMVAGAGVEASEGGALLSWSETLAQRLSEADRSRAQDQGTRGKKSGKKVMLLSTEQRRY